MTPFIHWISTFILALSCMYVIAQPPNDDCSGAIHLDIAASEATAIQIAGDTRNTIDEKEDSIPVCSGNFYRDAVWYSFIAPDTIPAQGISIKMYYAETAEDILTLGVALYASCEGSVDNQPLFCKNSPDGDRILLGHYCPELIPGETYYVRVWSASGTATDWTEGWGTFRIAAFVNEPVPEALDVIWDDGGFNGGIGDWTVESIRCGKDNNQNPVDSSLAKWTWAIGGLTKGNFLGGQRIGSETGCLGAMVFDSDFMDNGGLEGNIGKGPCPSYQEGTLTSPRIDLKEINAHDLYLWFYQQYYDIQSKFFVEYTLNDSIWNTIEINSPPQIFGDPLPQGITDGPLRLLLPGAAAADSIRIRFRIIANYYYWIIDDVKLIRPPCTDLALSDTTTVVPNKIWHQDQLHQIPIAIKVENLGLCPQEGSLLVVDLFNEEFLDSLVLSQSFQLPEIPVDTTVLIPVDCWEMPSLLPGRYSFRYTLVLTTPDAYPENNSIRSKRFAIDERLMAKDYVSWYALEPGSSDFTICNAYFIPNGKPYSVCEFEVGIGNAGQHLFSVFGQEEGFLIELHEGGDANQDGMIDLEVETVLVGQGYHLFQEEDKSKTIFNVALTDSTGQNCVALSDSTDYLAVVKYVPPDGQHYPLELFVEREVGFPLNRTATYTVANGGLGLCRPLPTTFLTTQKDGQLLSAISGEAYGVPMIRLALDKISPAQTLPPEIGGVRILPNPVNEFLTVEMDFVQPMDQVDIRISDITGKVMRNQTLSVVQQTTWTHNVSRLANGSYILYITTPQGVRTEKFVIQH